MIAFFCIVVFTAATLPVAFALVVLGTNQSDFTFEQRRNAYQPMRMLMERQAEARKAAAARLAKAAA